MFTTTQNLEIPVSLHEFWYLQDKRLQIWGDLTLTFKKTNLPSEKLTYPKRSVSLEGRVQRVRKVNLLSKG